MDNQDTNVIDIFSTITSSVFSELVIVITDKCSLYLPREFSLLRTMNEIIPFKLVFLLETSKPFQGKAQRELAGALESMTANGLLDFLDFLDSPPTTRIARPHEFPLL